MNYTHKWMIYVAELDGDKSEPRFVTAVRYHLHPSYKPFDIVDVTEPPFRLTRLGWGEFPIRLQLRFVDTHRNKSVDVIHHLKLDYTLSGRQMFGSERAIDIELDRSTDFNDKSPIQPAPPSTAEMQEAKSSTRLIHEEQEHTLGPDGHPMAHLHFCRFCGAPEHLSTDCHRIPNGWRKRGYGLCDRSSLSDSKLLLGMLSSYNQDEIAEIDDDMYRSIVPKLERYRDLAKLITNSAVVKIEQDASRQMALDWIWNVTSEIRLRTMVGSEIFLDKHSILQLPRSMALESNISTAMQQRLAVGDLLLQATKSFLRHLLISGVAVCRQQNLSSKETGHMLVPYHIHEATRLVSEFDFLSCKFMQKTPAESAKPK
ncbi:yeats-domain-containing protein [Hesseltinella vesiculosa]|uniref:Protein AF-9 homolog n=1 Tax=Hesseltinella vesiculosa TaxID=101127 RepID=A0A1X2G6J8_9FUNG|nr:yeats-domain-containing protein [Hesseltinella vesiculosa]